MGFVSTVHNREGEYQTYQKCMTSFMDDPLPKWNEKQTCLVSVKLKKKFISTRNCMEFIARLKFIEQRSKKYDF